MKYFISILLSFYLIFLFAFQFRPSYVYSETEDVQNITGNIGCGLLYNQCCTEPKSFKLKLPRIDIPVVGAALTIIELPVEFFINSVVGKMLYPVTSFVLNNIIGVDYSTDAFKCVEGKPIKSGNVCTCLNENVNSFEKLCLNIEKPDEKAKCISCVGSANCYWSGIGSIYTDLPSFINKNLFGIALSLAGVLAFLCIIYSAFILQTSAGNPERIKKAKQYLTSCITGLVLIIFSILILRIIGVDILRIPELKLN